MRGPALVRRVAALEKEVEARRPKRVRVPAIRVRQTLAITLDPDVLAELKVLAERDCAVVSRIVERALVAFLAKEKRK